MAKKWFLEHGNGVQIAVRVSPKSSKDVIDSIIVDADGREVLKLRVTAPPDKGKANTAVVKLLAKSWKLPVSSISIISGETSRNKLVRIEGDGQVLLSVLLQWDSKYRD